jgi:transposase
LTVVPGQPALVYPFKDKEAVALMACRKKKIGAQLVEDEDYQLRHEKVAGIDIAKDKGDVCTRLPPAAGGGRRRSRVEENVPARSADILELGSRLLADGVELVIMESTSDYWRIWYYLLESLGLAVALVNSSQARQLAGRPKTDRLDCQWLARLAEMGMLRPSFVPPPRVRALRDLTRARIQLVRDRARVWQRLEKLLEGALIKLSSELSSLAKVKTARLILDALADGERDPKALAGLALGTLRARRGELEAALDGMAAGPHHSRLIRVHLDHVALLDRSVAQLEAGIAAALEEIPAAWGVSADGEPSPAPGPGALLLPADARLAEIPGVSIDLARAIIAETGLDMSAFPTAAHLASWAGLAPVARQSGPRSRKPRKGQGNAYLKNHCTQAANGAARTSTFLGERHGRLARRIGPNRAKCAVARSILIIVWHLLNDPAARYTDLGPGWHQRKTSRDKKIRGHLRGLQSLGVDISALTAATG